MRNPFETVREEPGGWIRWDAPGPGTGFSPLPPPQEGTVTETDLFLLRVLWDLVPPEGAVLVTLPDHEVQRKYGEECELPRQVLDPGLGLAGERPGRGGPPSILVRPTRFGNVVDLFTFANREERGVDVGFLAYPDLPALGAGVDHLTGDQELDPGAGALTWGLIRTPGPETPAGLWLHAGERMQAIRAYLEALGERMQAEAAALHAGGRAAERRLLAALLG